MPLPCLCTNGTQLPEWTIQYSWRYARHEQSNRAIQTRAVSVEWRYVRYESITYYTNYITYPPVPSVQNVLLGSLSNPKNCHLGIKVAESAIPHRIFWLPWKMAYTLTRETEMTVAGIGLVLCAAAALEIEEEEKRVKKKQIEECKWKEEKKWRIGWKESNWASTGLCYMNWRKKILPASKITSEWTQIHLMYKE